MLRRAEFNKSDLTFNRRSSREAIPLNAVFNALSEKMKRGAIKD
jgi:hypothetical protein